MAVKELAAIDGWSSIRAEIGKYKDTEGLGLSGFYRREYKKSYEIVVLNKGHRMVTYKFPRVEIPFKSRMHRWRNLGFCGGWTFKENQSTEVNLMKAVIDGLKPVGFVCLTDYDNTDYVEIAKQSGMKYIIRQGHRWKEVGIANEGTFGSNFDLIALISSYLILEESHYGRYKRFHYERDCPRKGS